MLFGNGKHLLLECVAGSAKLGEARRENDRCLAAGFSELVFSTIFTGSSDFLQTVLC